MVSALGLVGFELITVNDPCIECGFIHKRADIIIRYIGLSAGKILESPECRFCDIASVVYIELFKLFLERVASRKLA